MIIAYKDTVVSSFEYAVERVAAYINTRGNLYEIYTRADRVEEAPGSETIGCLKHLLPAPV